ncbi:MAG: hypothetical protein UT33_C0006G0023 [Candidatus Peregrinibacteria bacterium GW2011_GWC2_39_14]|nr:MAG: hypothetical protein UT33_C0006G0023 [Candidatus Peregrinibacteria bacterium GW2011_GWC2_39_14]
MQNSIEILVRILIIYLIFVTGIFALNFSVKKIKFLLNRLRGSGGVARVFRIYVPRNSEVGPISAEQIFAALHAVKSVICFNVANIGDEIVFFVKADESVLPFLEAQIYAHYPDAEIVCMDDFERDGFKFGGFSMSLALNFTDIFPVKRYPQFEDRIKRTYIDPIAAVLSSLSKIPGSCVKIDVKPLSDSMRRKYIKCIRIYSRNVLMNFEFIARSFINAFCTRKIVYKIAFFPVYILFFVFGFLAEIKLKTDVGDVEEKTSRIHERESKADAVIDKVSKPMFEVSIKLFSSTRAQIFQISSSFYQFNLPYLNSFKVVEKECDFVLNIEELATVWHLPGVDVSVPGISYVKSKTLSPPSNLPNSNLILGEINFRDVNKKVGIFPSDRRRHVYILGKTGMGKSTLIKNMMVADIASGNGFGLIDPHGDLAESILDFVPSNRINDVIFFNPCDLDFPIGFNIFEIKNHSLSPIVASGIVGVFKKMYAESWGPRLEYILRNAILTLLEIPNSTLMSLIRIFQDDSFRQNVVFQLKDAVLRNFWINEFEKIPISKRPEIVSPILNKVGQFIANPIIRNILCQPKTKLDLRFIMDNRKIIIINLSKGKIGEDASAFLGSILITKFYIDAMSRADICENSRNDFYLYIDEFQNFATDAFSNILSEARKYKLNLTLANQYISQMHESARDAIFGNVGTIVAFQSGFEDAEIISSQFGEVVSADDVMFLPKYSAYTKLLIDGMPSRPFSIKTLAPEPFLQKSNREKIIYNSREKFAKNRLFVEGKTVDKSLISQ